MMAVNKVIAAIYLENLSKMRSILNTKCAATPAVIATLTLIV